MLFRKRKRDDNSKMQSSLGQRKENFIYVGIDLHKETHTAVILNCWNEKLGALDKSRANENEYIRKRKQVYKLLETCMNTDLLIFRHRKSTLFMV